MSACEIVGNLLCQAPLLIRFSDDNEAFPQIEINIKFRVKHCG